MSSGLSVTDDLSGNFWLLEQPASNTKLEASANAAKRFIVSGLILNFTALANRLTLLGCNADGLEPKNGILNNIFHPFLVFTVGPIKDEQPVKNDHNGISAKKLCFMSVLALLLLPARLVRLVVGLVHV